jgi:hypothetical protein
MISKLIWEDDLLFCGGGERFEFVGLAHKAESNIEIFGTIEDG